MASLGSVSVTALALSSSPPPRKPNSNHALGLHTLRTSRLAVTCKSSSSSGSGVDPAASRRDVLLGLGACLYGGAALTDPFSATLAAPVDGPNVNVCQQANANKEGDPIRGLLCCPPSFKGKEVKNFQLPNPSEPMRIRRPAHLAMKDMVWLGKYKEAVKKMRDLPEDDPIGFVQQAKIHCAYCNSAYVQTNDNSNKSLVVHASWMFLPFHRMYLHFYERILGSLIGDPTFALPFWNWDHEDGMAVADMFYDDPTSPLYDRLRNPIHLGRDKPLDLVWNAGQEGKATSEIVAANYTQVYKLMVSEAKRRVEFFGAKFHAGDVPPAAQGTCEKLHNMAHRWVGQDAGIGEDMGNFYSAGYDPLFFVHHCNVDRLWNVWKTVGKFRFDIDDYDYLNMSFLFYDENRELVRIKTKDVLDSAALRFGYEDRPLPWRNSKPTPSPANAARKLSARSSPGQPKTRMGTSQQTLLLFDQFPVKLDDKAVTVTVSRPVKEETTQKGKGSTREILVVSDIEVRGDKYVKFDVLINDDPDNPSGPLNSEFAGSFINIPHVHDHGGKMATDLRIDVTDLLEEIGAGNDDELVVTLVPSDVHGPIAIGEVKIELAPNN